MFLSPIRRLIPEIFRAPSNVLLFLAKKPTKVRFICTMHSQDDDTFLFTSESVGEGHPDKLCDQISDAVLDAHLQQDPKAKVACETVAKGGMILLCGEITSKATVDVQSVVRNTLVDIGYDHHATGLDANSCTVLTAIQVRLFEKLVKPTFKSINIQSIFSVILTLE